MWDEIQECSTSLHALEPSFNGHDTGYIDMLSNWFIL